LILGQLGFLLDTLLVTVCQSDELLQLVGIPLALTLEVVHEQGLCPYMLVKVHQHVLLQRSLSVVDADRVIVAVQAMDKRLDRWLVEVANVGGGLAGLVAHHESLGVDEAESIDDDFALDRLDGVNDDGDGARCELLE
jgi:hypothetical protein